MNNLKKHLVLFSSCGVDAFVLFYTLFFVSVFILDSAVLCSPDWIEIHSYSLLPAS